MKQKRNQWIKKLNNSMFDVAAAPMLIVIFGVPVLLALIVGCLVSFIVSMLVIKALMEYVRKSSFSLFGVYRIILGIMVLLYFILT